MNNKVVFSMIVFLILFMFADVAYTANLVATISVGRRATDIAFSPNGRRGYVNNVDDNTVSVIDIGSNRVIATIPVGEHPERPIVATNDRIYVPNHGRGAGNGTVSVIDATRNKVIRTVRVGVGPTSGAATFVHRTIQPFINDRVLVTNFNHGKAGTVSVIDVNTNRVVHTIKVGSGPTDIAIPFRGRKAYVANMNSRNITVIDIPSFDIIANIPVPGYPNAIFADTNSNIHTVYVSHNNPNGITAIDTERLVVSSTLNTAYKPGRVTAPLIGTINHIFVPIFDKNRVDRIDFLQRSRVESIPVDSPKSVAIFLPVRGQDTYVVGRNAVRVFNVGLIEVRRAAAPREVATCSISGRVTGKTIRFRVDLYGPNEFRERRDSKSMNGPGVYSFTGLPNGRYKIRIAGRELEETWIEIHPPERNVTCSGEAITNVNFELR